MSLSRFRGRCERTLTRLPLSYRGGFATVKQATSKDDGREVSRANPLQRMHRRGFGAGPFYSERKGYSPADRSSAPQLTPPAACRRQPTE